MVAEFWEKDAPKTVANFKNLSRQAFLTAPAPPHHQGLLIQGGDPIPRTERPQPREARPGYTISDEFNSPSARQGRALEWRTRERRTRAGRSSSSCTAPRQPGRATTRRIGHLICRHGRAEKIAKLGHGAESHECLARTPKPTD